MNVQLGLNESFWKNSVGAVLQELGNTVGRSLFGGRMVINRIVGGRKCGFAVSTGYTIKPQDNYLKIIDA